MTITLERSLYFDGELLEGELQFDVTSEHIYENAVVMLLCHFKGKSERNFADQNFCVHAARFAVATSDTGTFG